MRQIKILTTILILTIAQSCKHEDRTFPHVKKLSDFQNIDFIPTLEHKISKDRNFIYCSTLLYAWDEIRNTIKTPLQIDSTLYDLSLLNSSKSYLSTLKGDEYISEVEIDGDLITAKAEFKKSLPFDLQLNSFDNELVFNSENVKSFGTIGYDYKTSEIIKVLYYKDDNNFTLKLTPKDKEHEIILHMTEFAFTTMSDLTQDIELKMKIGETEQRQSNLSWKFYLTDGDEVIIPKFDFNIETNYTTLEGKNVSSLGANYRIEKAWQRTALVLNEKGAEVESESEIVAVADSVAVKGEKPRPKKMRFDKPFFLMLKRVDSKNPYFGLWTADTELMTRQ